MVVKSVGHPAKVCGQSGNLFIERMVIIIAFPPHTTQHIFSVRQFAFLLSPTRASRTIALLDCWHTAAAVVIRTFGLDQKKERELAATKRQTFPCVNPVRARIHFSWLTFYVRVALSGIVDVVVAIVVVSITCWVGFSLDLILPNLWRPTEKNTPKKNRKRIKFTKNGHTMSGCGANSQVCCMRSMMSGFRTKFKCVIVNLVFNLIVCSEKKLEKSVKLILDFSF